MAQRRFDSDDWGFDTEKPPLGLIPRDIFEGNRVIEIKEAIERYLEVSNIFLAKCHISLGVFTHDVALDIPLKSFILINI